MLDLESAQERAHINAFKLTPDQVKPTSSVSVSSPGHAWSVRANDDLRYEQTQRLVISAAA